MEEIFLNSIETPDGTVLISEYSHDFVSHQDANGNFYAVDGGKSYLKRVFDVKDYIEKSITSKSKIEDIRLVFTWGTFGKNGDQPRKNILLKDMSNEHIKAIIRTQLQISENLKKVFETELEYRQENNIVIED